MVDNYSLWESHDNENESRLENLPICDCCGEHIQQDTAVRINGCWFCDSCLDELREDTEREQRMWKDEKEELKRNIINGIKDMVLYLIAWGLLMIPVVKILM